MTLVFDDENTRKVQYYAVVKKKKSLYCARSKKRIIYNNDGKQNILPSNVESNIMTVVKNVYIMRVVKESCIQQRW